MKKILKLLLFLILPILLVPVICAHAGVSPIAGFLSVLALSVIPIILPLVPMGSLALLFSTNGISVTDKQISGTKGYVYWAQKAWLSATPDLADNPATATAAVVPTGSFTFLSTFCFRKIEVEYKSGRINSETTGKDGAYNKKHTIKFLVPRMGETAQALSRELGQAYGVFLIPDQNGNMVQLGTLSVPSESMTKDNSGSLSGEETFGIEVEVNCYSPALMIYTGLVQLTPQP